ncbi:ABC transporter ATP-binding protein [Streptomyces sp. URMC 123]|uniref:ABC transporter ATP-binding protein n=1 Tax=Streptomyces sp. URMC 123 TaxID=3423403 RepID=UPI003F1BCC98
MSVEVELRAARVRYGPLEALHGVDLVVPAERVTVLLGRNGAGRTTVLRTVAGTVAPASGRVVWRGTDVTRLPAHARARRGLCFVPDRRAVFASLTVAENLALASPGGDIAAGLDAFPALRPLLGRRAGTLSGGEQRMLALSRAVLSPARLLLFDEPTQGMSPAARARAYRLFGALAAPGGGRTVLVAEQSLTAELRAVTTVVHELSRGTVAFTGEPAELSRRPGARARAFPAERPEESAAVRRWCGGPSRQG